ncbi:putative hydrolase (Nudix family) [Xenorhabdus bovienii str. puntauvense]|uniref:Phosphatase nudJ n=2 Tax=Xenorhabdus bovienii TaxID=40576 RepID=A0A0B6X9J0_XENBV|nr:putative hydrolase (Nudix family) [Xenorhabdus bovienii str. feltiae France]CDG93141.1 putative hydrolase (Nudix family) [Xenorhabdus bovienii str. feltiae Florida]CDG97560.1 putative hydrolase (Nudix family) [Xenorhabdus bovienii str. puntauvense]CDM89816.1 Phosphatase nudJ [Xenorhabdus bovienii]
MILFNPHVTVACIVHAKSKFLIVEEFINEIPLWNQPAGHLEAGETLLEAAERELWEETGIRAKPQALLKLHQWNAPDGTPFIRFLFLIEMEQIVDTDPQDKDIHCCHWLNAEEILSSPQLRSPLVAESIRCYLENQAYPLSILDSYGSPFTK